MEKNFILIVFVFISTICFGQHHIEFDIKDYSQDTVIIGYYMLDKQLVHDTLLSNENGKYVLEGEENLPSGVYMLLTLPNKEYVQFLVSESEQNYKVSFNANQLGELKFENAPDNQQLNNFVNLLKEIRPEADILRDTIAKLKAEKQNVEAFQEKLVELDKQVLQYQDKAKFNNPKFISTKLLLANKEIVVPDFSDAEDVKIKRYEYYRTHYFDNIDMTHPASLRSPYLFQRIDYYINKLTPNHPDSISHALDYIFEKIEPAPETFKYYLSHYLNEYASSKVVGYDAIYVHLVDNYYANGKSDWVDEDNLKKIVKNANSIRPTLIGHIAADITVYKEDGTPITLSEIDYEYLILLFWAPDCGHCKKAMPDYVKFNDEWSSRGVKTLAICTKHQDKTKTCWDSIKEKGMDNFINAADEYHKSKFKVKYNVTKTPKLFILDKNREILIKNIGSDQLDTVMKEIIKIQENKDHNGHNHE